MGRLMVVAPLGPVVTGRSTVSRFMARAFGAAEIAVVEVNVGARSRSPWARALRPAAFGTAVARLLADRRRTIRTVYLAVDAGPGMVLTMAAAAAARVVGAHVVLHHHSYEYLRHRRRRAAWLERAAGAEALNIVQCPSMLARLGEHYGVRDDRGIVVSNAATVSRPPPRPRTDQAPGAGTSVSIGFLGDVTLEKGLAEAVATAVAVARRCPGSRLVVGGPCTGRRARSHLLDALRRYPGVVEYRGPLDEHGKEVFFASIDVFVFPSNYDHETQGVVNLEALAHGVPVVARGIGCIGEDLHGAPGMIVAEDQDFVGAAEGAIVGWAQSGELPALQDAARSHFDLLRTKAEGQYLRTVALIAELSSER